MGKQLVNPDINPKLLVLSGTSATSKTSFYFGDACGIAAQKLYVDTTNGVEMAVENGFTAANIKSFLQTYALLIKEYRFNAEDDADLTNNLTLVRCSIDGESNNEVAFSADATSPFANNPNLLLIQRPFVWTSTTALRITVPEGTGHDMTFTFTISTMIPYGQLDAYLRQNPINV